MSIRRGPTRPSAALHPATLTLAGALANDLPFQLGERAPELNHRSPRSRRRVQRIVQSNERHTAAFEKLEKIEQMPKRPCDPIELGDDNHLELAVLDEPDDLIECGA